MALTHDSDSDVLLYGSPTLPDVFAAANGTASFIHSFPRDWLMPAERLKRMSRSNSTPSLTLDSDALASAPDEPDGSALCEPTAPQPQFFPPPRISRARAVSRRSASVDKLPRSLSSRFGLLPPPPPARAHDGPLSAPAFKTSHAFGSEPPEFAMERPRRAWTMEDGDKSASVSSSRRARRGAMTSDKPLPPLSPPPFFSSRAVSDSRDDPESTRVRSSSHNGLLAALGDTTGAGKKNKLRLTVAKTIPRAISKHLRKHSSGDKLVADESFSCLGSKNNVDAELVSKQNASLQAVPDSFKRLFTPPNSAPPLPPLPDARPQDFGVSTPTDPCSTLLAATDCSSRTPSAHASFSHNSPFAAAQSRTLGVSESSVHPSEASTNSCGSSLASVPNQIPRTPDLPSETESRYVAWSAGETPVRRKRDGLLTAPACNNLRAQWANDDLEKSSSRQEKSVSVAASQSVQPDQHTLLSDAIVPEPFASLPSSGSDLGLDKMIWPVPPARSVFIDAVSRQGPQELSPKMVALPPSPLFGFRTRQDARACVQTSSSVPFEESLISSAGAQVAKPPTISSLPVHTANMSLPACPVVTVTMPSQRFDVANSEPLSPERLSPRQHPFKPRQMLASPSNARVQVYKADPGKLLPSKLFVSRDEKITIDASRWSELVAYCRENEDTIIRASAAQGADQPGIQRLQVCVWEVGDYNTNDEGEPDINDPKSFGVQMTLTIRPEAPRINTLLVARSPRNLSPSLSESPGSVYSSSPHASSAESLHSPSWLPTPPLSLNASTSSSSSSWASPAPPSVLFSDSLSENHTPYTSPSVLDSSIQSSALSVARKMQFTPLTSPNGSMIGLANIGADGFLKKPLVLPFGTDECVPPSPERAPRGRTRTRVAPRLQSQGREPSPRRPSSPHALKRELILNLSVPMPTLLGQIINVASQRSFGDGVNVPF